MEAGWGGGGGAVPEKPVSLAGGEEGFGWGARSLPEHAKVWAEKRHLVWPTWVTYINSRGGRDRLFTHLVEISAGVCGIFWPWKPRGQWWRWQHL